MTTSVKRALTVLVVEDDGWIRSLLSDLLPAAGYCVEEATNGTAGVRLAREHLPDIVLLDLALPEMSGIDVLRELKRDRSTLGIPVIVVSAYTAQLQLCQACEPAAVIEKPFMIGDLLAQVERVTLPIT